MLDKSRSMFLNGCFPAAKEAAVALDALIRSQFPRDDLCLVAFSLLRAVPALRPAATHREILSRVVDWPDGGRTAYV